MTKIKSFLYNIFPSTKTLIKNNKITSVILFIILIIIFYSIGFSSDKNTDEIIKVTKNNITQSVKVTGSIKAVSEANMTFEKSAPISYIGVKVGDKVPYGKILATVSSLDEESNLLQAEANLTNAEAVLNQLKTGARAEELAIKEQAIISADNNLNNVYLSLPDSIRNTDLIASDIIKNKLSEMFTYSGNGFILSFSPCDQSIEFTTGEKRTALEKDLNDFQKSVNISYNLSKTEDIDKAFTLAYNIAIKTNDLVSSMSSILLSPCLSSDSNFSSYRTTLSTVKTSINSLFADISLKRTNLISAKNNLAVAKSDFNLTKAGTDPNTIKAQEALVSVAYAKVLNAKSQLNKTRIVAPFEGVITDVSLVRGEVASLGEPVIKLISANSFEVEAKVREMDVAKIKVGDVVNITLDTYGPDILFPAFVSRINPSAESGDVPQYKVIISFKNQDPRIRDKMTANVSIVTYSKEDVITLPIRFVKSNDGVVSVKTETGIEERKVETGILGENGNIEIISGLSVGEEVVAITPGIRSSQKQDTAN